MFNGSSRNKKPRIEIPIVDRGYLPIFVFTPEEDQLLGLVSPRYSYSPLWGTQPLLKIAALIDLYDGCFPHYCLRNEALVLLRAQQVVDYCSLSGKPLPNTQHHNPIFDSYRKIVAERCRVFSEYTRQLFLATEQKMQGRAFEPLLSPQHVVSKKNKMG